MSEMAYGFFHGLAIGFWCGVIVAIAYMEEW